MTEQRPPAGWYPAQHANNEMRFWDGTRWLEPPNTTARVPQQAVPQPVPGAQPNTGTRKKSKKAWIIAGAVLAGLILIGGMANALGNRGNGGAAPAASTATASPAAEEEPTAEPEPAVEAAPVMVPVPNVVGMTAADAVATLNAAGLATQSIASFEDPSALVLTSSPAAGEEVEEGSNVALAVQQPPQLTLAQQNAVDQAQSYLEYSGFSRQGLIEQLEYEGFSAEDATFGADNAGADWNAEAAEKAESYLEYSSFSRQGLYDQLAYEGFTPEQIEYGLAQVGY